MKGRADDAGPDERDPAPSERMRKLYELMEGLDIPEAIWAPFLRVVDLWERQKPLPPGYQDHNLGDKCPANPAGFHSPVRGALENYCFICGKNLP